MEGPVKGADALGQPVSATGASTYVASSVLDHDMAVSERTLDTGATTTYLNFGLDPQTRRVTSQMLRANATDELDAVSYHYDLAGNVVRTSDREGGTGAPEQDTCYGYDKLDQLVQAWTATDLCTADPSVSGSSTVGGPQPFWESWSFDAAGDRTSQTAHQLPSGVTPLSGSNPLTPTTGSNVTTYSTGSTGHAHALTGSSTTGPAAGSTAQGVDADGQVISRTTAGGSQTIGWDQLGQIGSVTTPAGTTSYVNDASGTPLLESDPSGATTLFLGSEDITVTGASVSKVVRYYSVGGDEIAYRVNSAGPTYLENDLQGTTRVTYTPSAAGSTPEAKVGRQFADPYGNNLAATNGSSLVTPTLPTGRSFLAAPANGDTGLISLGVRKYDPVTGTFLSVDPVQETNDPAQLNGYTYGAGNPVTDADPTGAMFPSGGTSSSGGGSVENGPHSYRCRTDCGWSRNDTHRYDVAAAARRRREAAEWRAEQAWEASARQRAAYAAYQLTHGGSRAYRPRPAPRPHVQLIVEIAPGEGGGGINMDGGDLVDGNGTGPGLGGLAGGGEPGGGGGDTGADPGAGGGVSEGALQAEERTQLARDEAELGLSDSAAEEAPEIAEANVDHIFRDAPGHLAEDTPENRALIESAVKPGNYVRTGGGGEALYRETLGNGTQVWAKVFRGEITNGGVNQTPLP